MFKQGMVKQCPETKETEVVPWDNIPFPEKMRKMWEGKIKPILSDEGRVIRRDKINNALKGIDNVIFDDMDDDWSVPTRASQDRIDACDKAYSTFEEINPPKVEGDTHTIDGFTFVCKKFFNAVDDSGQLFSTLEWRMENDKPKLEFASVSIEDDDWKQKVDAMRTESIPQMRIINLTPHEINLHKINGEIINVPPSGKVARLEQTSREISSPIEGVKVTTSDFGNITNLPEPHNNTIFIVSALVMVKCKNRRDVFAPGKAIRDKDGKIIGCDGLSQ
jgi:hypothetical protein